ncbi:MAG TPA: FAD-dependent monooxygenase [Sphingobium sp.]
MRRTPPLIAGGGPAGSAAAIALAQAGIRATLLEKGDDADDAICGGFLSWATLDRLEHLGIDVPALGGNPLNGLALFLGRREHILRLPKSATGMSRRRLDAALRARAEMLGADVRLGLTVRSADGGILTLADGDRLVCDSLFLATGKHDLRGLARPKDAASPDPELGLRFRLPPAPERSRLIADRIELHLFDDGYLGLVLQEDGSANACLAVRKSRLAKAGGNPAGLIAAIADASPALADRLADFDAAIPFDAIGHVPYGWRARRTEPGIFRLGDQAAVIPSLAGEGIGIALASADLAVRHWLKHGPEGAEDYQRRFARAAWRPLAIAGALKDLAGRPARAALPAALIASVPGAARLLARLTRI